MRDEGVHVIRQHAIGRYTVDFAIRKHRVAIEIDGGVHDMPGRREYDAARQEHLEGKGWRFVRFRSEETYDVAHIINKVRAALPLPLREGGGGLGEPPTSEGKRPRARNADAGGSPHPLAPSSQEEGERPRMRRTRANRVLKPRRKQ